MALQTFDFLNARTQVPDYSSIGQALPNFLEGYKISKAPAKMAEEQRKAELANALSQLELQYKPEDYKTQFDLRRAQAEHARQQAQHTASGGGLQGHARNIADLNKLLNDPNVPQQYKDMAVELFKADLAKSNSLVDTRQQNIQFKNFGALPADQKEKSVGQYAALGIGARDAVELYNNGVTPELLTAFLQQNPQASMHEAVAAVVGQIQGGHGYGTPQPMPPAGVANAGANPSQMPQQQNTTPPLLPADTRNVPIQPAMTATDRSAYNTIQGGLAEESYIAPIIADAMKDYSTKYAGYSPSQFFDTFSDDPAIVDKMAKFYAARALQPEIAGNRARLANSSTAQGAMEDIKHDSLNAIDIMDWRVSPEAYAKAQEYISQWIQGMASARAKGMSGQMSPGFQTVIQDAGKLEAAGGSNPTFDPNSDDPFGLFK